MHLKHNLAIVIAFVSLGIWEVGESQTIRPIAQNTHLPTDPSRMLTDPDTSGTDPEAFISYNERLLQQQKHGNRQARRADIDGNQSRVIKNRIEVLKSRLRDAGDGESAALVDELNYLYGQFSGSKQSRQASVNTRSGSDYFSSRATSNHLGRNEIRLASYNSNQDDDSLSENLKAARELGLRPEIQSNQIVHQPLIQIRVRVVDVARNDSFAASSVLDYIASDPATAPASLINGNNINNNQRNATSAQRFGINGLLAVSGTALNNGSGSLVNLTGPKLNWIISLLATELNGDIVTAPEVVTLNGQNVEFVSGEKVPFEIGQNVVTGNTNSIQTFFYKHVGTFITVTPRIVNWGPDHRGRGRIPSNSELNYIYFDYEDVLNYEQLWQDLQNYPHLIEKSRILALIYKDVTYGGKQFTGDYYRSLADGLNQLVGRSFIDFDASGNVSECKITRRMLIELFGRNLTHECCNACDWEPNDCTIDLSLLVRLSGAGGADANRTAATSESDVRAIKNIVQVKNGHGVVIGGLITESEEESLQKTPILGDLPFVGALFRARSVQRQKLETLIFVEARVLDHEPEVARVQSYEDFSLSSPYARGSFLENPLECGSYRAGFGSYLPPTRPHEEIYWERFGRKIRKATTQGDDLFHK